MAQSAGAVECTDHPHECPGCDTEQSDGEAPVNLEFRWVRSAPSLALLPGPLLPGVVAPGGALSVVWIELTAYLCWVELFQLELFDWAKLL